MKTDNHILVIFGASGDLAEKKLVPALERLAETKLLPERFAVLGVGRTPLTDDTFREKLNAAANNKLSHIVPALHYLAMDTGDAGAYGALKTAVDSLAKKIGIDCNCIFYLSIPPSWYATVVKGIASVGLNRNCKEGAWKRIVVEKPFGYDLPSAKALNRELLSVFSEEQIYRIDHYLGKETVQNILVTRFGNAIFEPVWNRNYIERVEITAAEQAGVGNRGGYYEGAGALRDMVQNHLMQVAALAAMEAPSSASDSAIRNESLRVFQALRPIADIDQVVRAQYTGAMIAGKHVPGYRDEHGVAKDSRTETFAAMTMYIDNWRWHDVPFFLRTGKRLPSRVSEVVIYFKPVPHKLFDSIAHVSDMNNRLIIRIQPDEGLLLKYAMKTPGAGFTAQTVNMDFHYRDLGGAELPEAYERLLLDCMQGDQTLYLRADALEATWAYITPVLDRWGNDPAVKMYGYPAGTWGPPAAEDLAKPYGGWRQPCRNLSNDGTFCEL